MSLSFSRPAERLRLPKLQLVRFSGVSGFGGVEGRLPIMLGVLLAVVAALLVFVGLQHARDQANAPEEVTPVVVAASNIPQGTLLSSNNIPTLFKVTRVAASGAPQDALSSVTTLEGQMTAVTLTAGDTVLASSISTPADSTASGPRAALLPPGDVAIVLPVNDNISVGGAIVPTDRVDVIATIPVPSTNAQQPTSKNTDNLVTQAVLRDVRVLATGFRTRPPAQDNGQSDSASTNPTPYSTLTLAVSPQDAVLVQHLLAENVRLALALRRPGEQTVPTTAITTSDLAHWLALSNQQGATGQPGTSSIVPSQGASQAAAQPALNLPQPPAPPAAAAPPTAPAPTQP
jgi:pilus assembly protein CpaB